jgi:hypothetical protein
MVPEDDEKPLALESGEESEASAEEKRIYLRRGRTAVVSAEGIDEVLEIRSDGGAVELRIKLTEAGPVLQVEGVKLDIKAAEEISLESKKLSVAADEVAIASRGDLLLTSEGEMDIKSPQDVRVRGKIIWLN